MPALRVQIPFETQCGEFSFGADIVLITDPLGLEDDDDDDVVDLEDDDWGVVHLEDDDELF